MELKAYSLHDNVAKIYNKPFFVHNRAIAQRSIQDAMKKDEHIREHSDDYTLFEIGEYNDQTGEIKGYKDPQKVIALRDFNIN